MGKILVAGLDGAKKNFGITKMSLDLDTMELDISSLRLVETQPDKHKKVRASSDNLRRAQEICEVVRSEISDCTAIFAEIPSGGQSYDAVLGFGIVIGIYAYASQFVPLVEVAPNETKLATVGTRTASKEEMIAWAAETYPNAPWLTRKFKGKTELIAKNEHLADAAAIVHAGIKTPTFKQTLSILRAQAAMAA